MRWLFRDSPADPKLAAALRGLEQPGQLDGGEPLRRKILATARPKLAELRAPAPQWWEWISRWMPVAVPVGLAAALAAALLLPGASDLTALTAAEVSADSTLVIAAFAESPAGGQLVGSLVAPESAEWLWQQAVAQRLPPTLQ